MHFATEIFCAYFFFFNDTATTEIYTLSLHDALPISACAPRTSESQRAFGVGGRAPDRAARDHLRRSEEHTSELSHVEISYAVFCLKKKKNDTIGDPSEK